MSKNEQYISALLGEGEKHFLSNISIDTVILGYEENSLKVLLLRVTEGGWMLPGGYVFKNESLDEAASRILEERIALRDIFLKQFHVFGEPDRSFSSEIAALFGKLGAPWTQNLWINQRFISVGYYALVDIARAAPRPNIFSKSCSWHPVEALPALLLDHKEIIEKALHGFQNDLQNYPLGFHLLPSMFTMPELHGLFETVYRKSLDRSRFQKKMLSYGVFERLEKKKGVAHRSPFLYRHRE
ncbi:MAG: NUDIX hydrolase [Imperialibacter sp.]|uniref:NUDIX hydrolase n=1 Tax=Imperialibacter sp. TaxID=2038411 RepID=UPI003A89E874